ncbi:PEP [Choristoneura occidentalis granulovirus]|jgi:hypothetical protein|uniref:PEP n=1 Tax=Choristoneura occidentalis granulovirus TaxID=364745 RepID=Q1A4S7_9BBAC|nr:PEP [Choristoneura fumiferana granulovirus]ABC61153.1 PEP [Choristoneura fumiferana granulovirus]
MSCLFTKNFDGVNVPFLFLDMTLWVGADEVLRILKLPTQILFSLPDSEKTTLKQLKPCSDNNKWFITSLGVGLLVSRLINRGYDNESLLPERANAFANIFITDIVFEIRVNCLICSISKTEDAVLNLLNEPILV